MAIKIESLNDEEKAEIIATIKEKKDFDCLVKTELADDFIEFVEARGHTAKRGEKHVGGYTMCFVFVTQ